MLYLTKNDIYQGGLKMKINIADCKISKLELSDLDSYISFESLVKSSMEHPEWLGDFSKDDYNFLLNNNSYIFVWTINNEIAASGMIMPSREQDLPKFFSSELNYKEVIDFGPQMVNPKYIGNGLQQNIINYLQHFSKNIGYKYALATVHPDNIYSKNNFFKTHFEILGEMDFKRGKRIIVRKKLG